MELKKEWNNWQIFLASIVLALVFTFFIAPSYFDIFQSSGGLIADEIIDMVESYTVSFLLFYVLFIPLFYKAFSRDFKPITLIYFTVLPFLLFFSSLPYLAAFLALLTLGWLLGKWVREMRPAASR